MTTSGGTGPRLLLRRSWSFRGHLALLGVLTIVATGLVVGAPRLANHLVDAGLRERVSGLAWQVRDLTYQLPLDPAVGEPLPRPGGWLETQRRTFAPPLAELIRDRWYAAQLGPAGVAVEDDHGGRMPFNGTAAPAIGLRHQTGVTSAATLAEGRWPAPADPGEPQQAAASADVAGTLGLRVGSRFRLDTVPSRGAPIDVVLVGVFAATDERAPVWDQERELLRPYVPVGRDNDPYRGVLLVDESTLAAAAGSGWPAEHSWRYRLDERRMTAADLGPVTAALVTARQRPPLWATATTSLDTALAEFDDRLSAARAVLAVVQAGVLATLFGLVLLAAAAAVERRRAEFGLLRARGAANVTLGGRALAESLLVVPLGAAAGWLAAGQVPGRPAGTGWLAALFAAATAAAVPVLAMAAHRRLTEPGARRELVGGRPSPTRLTGEVSILIAAAAGVVLLRRRGLDAAAGVDPYLVSIPVLLATAAALVALRAFPTPVRLLGRLAARARGSVLFLGLVRAGRAAPASAGPVAVMVVAIATGVFSAVVTTALDEARDRATDEAIAADVRVTGGPFAPSTTGRIGDLPGVTAVAPLAIGEARDVLSDTTPAARTLSQVLVVAVDMSTLRRVAAASGVPAELPPVLADARPGAGPVPALVSPLAAAEIGAGGAANLQGALYEFRVAEVADRFPTVPAGATRFVVLPWQALATAPGKPLLPTGFLVAGPDADPAAIAAAGDLGHLEWLTATAPRATGGAGTVVTTWGGYRQDLEGTGLNGLLRFTFAAGATGGTVLALLAVGFAVLAGARSRGQVLSRLRTMGMSPGQGRGLLVLELAPLVGLGVVTGALVGAALPHLLAPALGLDAFSAGYPLGVRLHPAVLAGVLGLVVLGLVAAMAAESAVNRRLRLGDVLRLGEET